MKVVVHLIMLFMTPFFLIYPENYQPNVAFQPVCLTSEQDIKQKNVDSLTYDEILNFLNKIEMGELEDQCSSEELQQINLFITFLAKQGLLPHDFDKAVALERDTQRLLKIDGETLMNMLFPWENVRCCRLFLKAMETMK